MNRYSVNSLMEEGQGDFVGVFDGKRSLSIPLAILSRRNIGDADRIVEALNGRTSPAPEPSPDENEQNPRKSPVLLD